MSHKPDAEKTTPQDSPLPEPPRFLRSFLLADDGTLEPVKVELVEHPIKVQEPQFEALVADAQCEV
jgi:hypothetical protein